MVGVCEASGMYVHRLTPNVDATGAEGESDIHETYLFGRITDEPQPFLKFWAVAVFYFTSLQWSATPVRVVLETNGIILLLAEP